jgi:hypothetical protein
LSGKRPYAKAAYESKQRREKEREERGSLSGVGMTVQAQNAAK